MNKNDSFGIFCIVDGRRLFNSSQLDNPIFHDLGFDKPLYGQNPIPTDGFPQQLCIMNYELIPFRFHGWRNANEKRDEPLSIP